MLKISLRRFSVAALAATLGMTTAAASAQLTALPAAPRKDTPRSNDTQPASDSRAGGALSRNTDPVEGAEIVGEAYLPDEKGVTDRAARLDVDGGERGTVFSGLVTGVGSDSITVQMGPPRVPKATEQIFKISTKTPVMVNGQKGALTSVKKGSFVRIMTMPGDLEVASRIVVATPPGRVDGTSGAPADGPRPKRMAPAVNVTPGRLSEDEDTNFDVFPDKNSAPAKRGQRGEQPGAPDQGRMAAQSQGGAQSQQGGEEAVLPLGIEVYGPGEGALVTEMLAQGPAAQAGIAIGDFITQVNGNPIGDPEAIEQMMQDNGQTGAVILTVMRGGKSMEVTVEPAQAMEGGLIEHRAILNALAPYGFAGPALGGVGVPYGAVGVPGAVGVGGFIPGVGLPFGGPLTNFNGGGVQIRGQQAQLANGLQPNDVIVGFDGQPIETQDQLYQALNGLPQNANALGLSVLRNGQRVNVNVPRSSLTQNAINNAGAPRATGTRNGTTFSGPSGPNQRATGTLSGTVGTNPAGAAAAGNVNPTAARAVGGNTAIQRRAINPGAAAGNAAAAGGAAAARAAAVQGNAAAGGTALPGATAGQGGAAGATGVGGAGATGGAAAGGTGAPQ